LIRLLPIGVARRRGTGPLSQLPGNEPDGPHRPLVAGPWGGTLDPAAADDGAQVCKDTWAGFDRAKTAAAAGAQPVGWRMRRAGNSGYFFLALGQVAGVPAAHSKPA